MCKDVYLVHVYGCFAACLCSVISARGAQKVTDPSEPELQVAVSSSNPGPLGERAALTLTS